MRCLETRRQLKLERDAERALRRVDPRDLVYELRRDGEHERAFALRRALRARDEGRRPTDAQTLTYTRDAHAPTPGMGPDVRALADDTEVSSPHRRSNRRHPVNNDKTTKLRGPAGQSKSRIHLPSEVCT